MTNKSYKFTSYVELFQSSVNRPIRYYVGVDDASSALSWINEMSAAVVSASGSHLVSFGFYENKEDSK